MWADGACGKAASLEAWYFRVAAVTGSAGYGNMSAIPALAMEAGGSLGYTVKGCFRNKQKANNNTSVWLML